MTLIQCLSLFCVSLGKETDSKNIWICVIHHLLYHTNSCMWTEFFESIYYYCMLYMFVPQFILHDMVMWTRWYCWDFCICLIMPEHHLSVFICFPCLVISNIRFWMDLDVSSYMYTTVKVLNKLLCASLLFLMPVLGLSNLGIPMSFLWRWRLPAPVW